MKKNTNLIVVLFILLLLLTGCFKNEKEKDKTRPIITLIGSEIMEIYQDETYTDPGYSAIDDTDGNITNNVIVKGNVDTTVLGTYTITYNVKDKAGNKAKEKRRKVSVIENEENNEDNNGEENSDQNNDEQSDDNQNNDDTPVVTLDTTDPVITLVGASLTLKAGETFTDPGYSATDNIDGNITKDIIVGGDIVDTNTLGAHTISYDVEDSSGNSAITKYRTVYVIDDTIPIIVLVNAAFTLEVGTDYVDPGYTAIDNYDGVITNEVEVVGTVNSNVLGEYTVTYNVEDSSGNSAEERVRTVTIEDTTIPVITLTDGNITLEYEATYSDPGYTATDNYDGTISGSVIVGGDTIDTSTPGDYTITYNVTDSSGNSAEEKTRTVTVSEPANADVSGANEPILPTNMIPVYYDYTADVWKKADTSNVEGDNQWYDYENSIWANGVMVKSASRDTYLSAEAGAEINFDDIMQFYVWIPRYKYRIEDTNFHKTTLGLVGVVFESGTESTGNAIVNSSTGFEDGEYLTHPAFCVTNNDDNGDGNWSTYLGDDCDDPDDWNLTGFWVAKFEASYHDGDYSVIPTLSNPNNYVEAHAHMEAENFYNYAQDLDEVGNNFGFVNGTDDTHLINAIEWGAISYLGNSNYGRGANAVWINPSIRQLVGCVGTSAQPYYYNGYNVCEYEYNDETYGGKSSTTGNVSGVYDMAGGVEEYTAAVKRSRDGFNGAIYDDVHSKYANDLGELAGAWTLDLTIGMGLWETGSRNDGYYTWNGDRALWYWSLYSNYSVLARGNKAQSYQYAGIYSYRIFLGAEDYDIGWRPTLVVEQ